MREETARRLHKHGVKTVVSYGQTETAGLVMLGIIGADEAPAAMRPITDAYIAELVDESNTPVAGPGTELPLVIRNCPSIYIGYVGKPPRPDFNVHLTGDVFEELDVNGQRLLRHVCRGDDLLNHTSGEMTNPLPTEHRLQGLTAGKVQAMCMCGTNRPPP